MSTQLQDNVPEKTAKDGPSIWPPATHMGDQDGVTGSWNQPGPALVVEAILGE